MELKAIITAAALLAFVSTATLAEETTKPGKDQDATSHCVYAGQAYSEGSVIKTPDNKLMSCTRRSGVVFDQSDAALVWAPTK